MAIEVAANNPNNTDLELIGLSELEHCDIFKEVLRSNSIDSSHLLRNSIGLNNYFYYSIECIPNNKKNKHNCVRGGCVSERGVGYLYEQDNKFFLKREIPVSNTYADGNTVNNTLGNPQHFICCDDSYTVLITAVLPTTVLEALVIPHSALVSGENSFIPAPVQIKENSFLARLADNIQSLSFSSEHFINIIISIISNFSKQLKLKTSKLTVKRVETNIIDIKPSNSHKAVRGSLCYDEQSNKLKFYDGEKWKQIVLSD